MTIFRQAALDPFLSRDIKNLNTEFNRQQRRGLPTTHALVQNLKSRNVHCETKLYTDPKTGEEFTGHIFIALPESIKLACNNMDIVLVDNTYKTNKFNLLLLHMVGK